MVARGYRGDARTLDRFRVSARSTSPWLAACAVVHRCSCSEATVPSALSRCSSARTCATRYLERFPALDGVSLDVAPGENARAARRQRLRQVDAAEGARRAASSPTPARYRAFGELVTEDHLEDEQFSTGFRSPGRLHLPEHRRAGVLADGARGGRVRPAAARPRPRRGRAADRRRAGDARDRRPRRPGAVPAVRRPEEARRDRLGARHEPRGDPVRRADRRRSTRARSSGCSS